MLCASVHLPLFSPFARATCDDIEQHLNVPVPLDGDTVIDLDDVSVIECEELSSGLGGTALEVVTVSEGTLTLRSTNTVR